MNTITVVVNFNVASNELATYLAQVSEVFATLPAELQAKLQNLSISTSQNP